MSAPKAKNITIALQTGTTSTYYARWDFKLPTSKQGDFSYFAYHWYYDTGDGVWFSGSKGRLTGYFTSYGATYNVPQNAIRIKISVKPYAVRNNNNRGYRFTGDNATKSLKLPNTPVQAVPVAPAVSVSGNKLTASLVGITDANTNFIQFGLHKNSGLEPVKTIKCYVRNGKASAVFKLDVGYSYTVKARGLWYYNKTGSGSNTKGVKPVDIGDWGDASTAVTSAPATPKQITKLSVIADNAIWVEWSAANGATMYEVQYTTNKTYFSQNPSEVQSVEITSGRVAQITGLALNSAYYFRVRAKDNNNAVSGWTAVKGVRLGSVPDAPTTWADASFATLGSTITLNASHNATDESFWRYAQIQTSLNGASWVTDTQTRVDPNEDELITKTITLDNQTYSDGDIIRWRVRTKGFSADYSPWSVIRNVGVFGIPTVELTINDDTETEDYSVNVFPFTLKATVDNDIAQNPTGYSIQFVSNEQYETTDAQGEYKLVNAGEVVFNEFYVLSDDLEIEFSPEIISLADDVSYSILCTASFDSGLTAEDTFTFSTDFPDDGYYPDATVTINKDDGWTAEIHPFCLYDNDLLVPVGDDEFQTVAEETVYVISDSEDSESYVTDMVLTVCRIEHDGTLTTIAEDLPNEPSLYISDPHPTLDNASYRVIATSLITGISRFYDAEPEPVDCKKIVITWDEQFENDALLIDDDNSDEIETRFTTKSIVELPYNVSINETNDIDVKLVEYIGREHPVSYYGTQKGHKATWSCDIQKSDTETLDKLRRLAIYMGDAYVREPSGTGYWATVKVTIGQSYESLKVPVNFAITRVEGGK